MIRKGQRLGYPSSADDGHTHSHDCCHIALFAARAVTHQVVGHHGCRGGQDVRPHTYVRAKPSAISSAPTSCPRALSTPARCFLATCQINVDGPDCRRNVPLLAREALVLPTARHAKCDQRWLGSGIARDWEHIWRCLRWRSNSRSRSATCIATTSCRLRRSQTHSHASSRQVTIPMRRPVQPVMTTSRVISARSAR
jgi:hypothetical protein